MKPPFTPETARAKVKAAEDAWNSKNPALVSLAYSEDSEWRNRSEFIKGRHQIVDFLTRKWNTELEYKLKKELWSFRENRIAVKFTYEYRDANHQWYRAHGNELWEFNKAGLMTKRYASINDISIDKNDRIL